jgi:hypothetical protein
MTHVLKELEYYLLFWSDLHPVKEMQKNTQNILFL